MKPLVYALAIATLAVSCKQQEKKTETTETATTETTVVEAPKGTINDSTADATGNKLYMSFDTAKAALTVTFNGEKITMPQVPSGSGIRYEGNGYAYEEWHQEIRLYKGEKVVFENALAAKNSSKNATSTIDEPAMPEAFIGENNTGDRLNVGYNTSGAKPVAYIAFFDDPIDTLVQTSAWAKGGVYKSKKMTWEVSGNKGTLTIGGKKHLMKRAN